MDEANIPLIVGAGPVGLGAALLLRRAGTVARIIDADKRPASNSKALAVNPRTLELLEPTGVTEKMLAIGLCIHRVRMHFGATRAVELSLDSLKHKYPFMLALSQATTERLLNDALEAAGGRVERGVALITCRSVWDCVEAELKSTADNFRRTVRCPWLLAADGAHSVARKALNINFAGSSFPRPWYLVDVPLTTSLENDLAHVFFLDDGAFLFLIRVVDETSEQVPGPKVWRVISNQPNPVARVPDATPAGAPVWSSEFHISHRINEHLKSGHVYFAGDAAHIHSPLGARGMNLGIEDAWVFCRLVGLNQMERYESLRKDCDRAVVKRVEALSRLVMARSKLARRARETLMPLLVKVPFLRTRFLAAMTGLDHELNLPQEATKKPSEGAEHGLPDKRVAA